jgi:outer membrane biosynthesis protein TonB
MRQFAERVVAQIRMRLHSGIDYPAEALANRWEGTVQLAILYPWGGGPEQISVFLRIVAEPQWTTSARRFA